MEKKQINLNKLTSIIKYKEQKELNRLRDIQKGKETIVIENKKIHCYISTEKVTVYLDVNIPKEKKESVKEEINFIFNRMVTIVNTFMDYLIPSGVKYIWNGMTVEKKIKVGIGKEAELETIDVLISDKWLFVTASVYSESQFLYQNEVLAIDPITKKEVKKVCNRDTLSRSQMCLSFLSNELDVSVEDGKKGDYSKFFFDFINLNNKKLEKKSTIPTLGWNKDLTEFAPYSDKLHLDFSTDKYNFFRNLSSGLKAKNTKKENIEEFKKKLLMHSINPYADFAISCAFAAPLMKIVGVRSFLINLYGESKTQKSLSTRIGLSCFGNYKELEMNGNDTKNAVKTKIYKLQNLLCYIDEVVQKGDVKNIPISPYDFGNEKDRQRLDHNAEIKATKGWKTICVCSSEMSIAQDTDIEGEINRSLCLNVNCIPAHLKDNEIECQTYAQDYYRFLEKNYGFLGESYIKEITRLNKSNPEILTNWYEQIKNKLVSINNNTNIADHISSISIICLANYIYKKLFYNISDINQSIMLGEKILKSIKTKKELNPHQEFLNCVYSFFEINSNCFNVIDKQTSRANIKTTPNSQIYGAVNNDKKEIIFILRPLQEYIEKNGFSWNYKSNLIKEGFMEYKPRRINGNLAKRIIVPLVREELEADLDEIEERKAIQEEMKHESKREKIS